MNKNDNSIEITDIFNTVYNETFAEIRRMVAVKCFDTSYINDSGQLV